MPNANITLYTHPDCSYSLALKHDLDRDGIDYSEIDISLSTEAAQELIALTGGDRITPVLVEDGRVMVGYNGIG